MKGRAFLAMGTRTVEGFIAKSTALIPVILVLLLATLLRFNRLDSKSLWQDEITTLKHVHSGDALDVLSSVLNKELPAPPLYFLLTRAFSALGEGDLLLRFPSAAFGVLGVAATYALGKTLFGRTEGLLAAFLLSLSSFHVRYSQEARGYALFMFLSILALYFLWKVMRGHETKWWVGFVLANLLLLYTHLFALLVLLAEGVIFLSIWLLDLARCRPGVRSRVARAALRFWGSMTIILVGYLPMAPYLWQGMQGGKGLGGVGFTFGMSLTLAFFAQFLGALGGGTGAALCIFTAGFLVGLGASLRRQGAQALLALLWIVVPFGVLFAFPARHGFRPRYLVFILPVYLVFVGRGLVSFGRLIGTLPQRSGELRRPRLYAAWLLLSLLLFGVLGLSSLYKYWIEPRPDWRAAATFLANNLAPGEALISRRELPQIVLPHYRRELAEVQFMLSTDPDFDPQALGREKGVWLVRAGRSIIPLAEEIRGSRDVPIFSLVFGADPRLVDQAIAEGIAPAMFKNVFIAYVREGIGVEELTALYEDALALAPVYDRAGIHSSLGDLLLQEGALEDAILHYREAVSLDPDAPSAHNGLAQAYEERGWHELAAREWELFEELTAE